MGRRSHSQTLHLWANGDYVGRWTVKANGASELQYDASWQSSRLGCPISLSLPFNLRNEPLKGASVANIVEKVRSELPVGFSEKVADKILGGLLDTAAILQRMPPA